MAQYLIGISIGPVQDFIAAARRTRDLWFGSELLSEISKSVALALYDAEAELIFPAPEHPSKLGKNTSFNVGNKLLACVSHPDIAQLAAGLRQTAKARWHELAKVALSEIKGKKEQGFNVNQDLWDAQIDDVIEFFSAWVVYDGSNYSQQRERVDALLAARKNSRDFLPASTVVEYGIAKSSLDGLRESVLLSGLTRSQCRKLGLNDGEHLDCPGVVKRLGGDAEQFTPISRIALDPWVRSITEKTPEAFAGINQVLDRLVRHGLTSRVDGNNGCYRHLPYDGQLLYPFRLEAMKQELRREKETEQLALLNELENAIQTSGLQAHLNSASPYMAVLLADGDRMGALLDAMDNSEQHKKVSRSLAAFAGSVADTVRKHNGHAIYAGGDDVLALLPLDQALACAQQLHQQFGQALDTYQTPGGQPPSLSVGIAIAHMLEPMGSLLDLARWAEKLAKGNELKPAQQRDGLGIILKPRSGSAIHVRSRWPDSPLDYFNSWIDAHINDQLPDGAAYELKRLARDLAWAEDDDPQLILDETARVLKRKRAGYGERSISNTLIEQIGKRVANVGLETVAEEIIVCRRLADAVKQNPQYARGASHA